MPNMTSTKTPVVGGERHTVDPDLDYLSPADVGRVLRVTREYAGRLMRAGTIPGVVDLASRGERARLRVSRSDLQAWVDSRAL